MSDVRATLTRLGLTEADAPASAPAASYRFRGERVANYLAHVIKRAECMTHFSHPRPDYLVMWR